MGSEHHRFWSVRMTIRDLIDSGKISLDTVVLGELPMTADGCVIGEGARIFKRNEAGSLQPVVALMSPRPTLTNSLRLYSSMEAAERAAKEGK